MKTNGKKQKLLSGIPTILNHTSASDDLQKTNRLQEEETVNRISRLYSFSQDEQQARRDYSSLQEFFTSNTQHVLIAAVNYLATEVEILRAEVATLKDELAKQKKPAPVLLDTDEACAYLKMHPDTLYKYRKEGKIHGLRMGRGFLYQLSDLMKLAEKGRTRH